jgi:carboxyl-terminal processing protease
MIRSAYRAAVPPMWRSRLALVGLLLLLPFLVAATPRVAVYQADPESGITLMTAVYNSLQDRFFRPVDSREVLDAAWQGATRGLADQRSRPREVQAPRFTGDRAGDLDAFVTQYRALLASAGESVDATRVAMVASDFMAQSVDERHTYFMEPEDFAQYTAELTTDDERVGLGVVVEGTAAPFIIRSVVPSGPADKAGVLPGDEITAVNGIEVAPLRQGDLFGLVGGESGTAVHLTLLRGQSTVDVTVVRAPFSEPPLIVQVLPEGICHLSLRSFPVSFSVGPTGRTIGQELDYQLDRCEQAGAKGWVMDLRGNGGGNSVAEVLGRFMDAGPIMVERDRAGNRYEQATDGHLFRVQRPLVVLIDDGSASASEVFASAVQEYKRGVVMGQRSAGILNTTIIIALPLGAGMGVTYRGVFTGKREVVVNDVGVEPDVRLGVNRDATTVPPQAIQAALNPPPGVGPLPPGPSPTDGLLSADELKRRVDPVLLRAGDAEKPEDQVEKGDLAIDTYQYYSSDYPSLTAARERAVRLGWQGTYVRWIGGSFPPPYAVSVSIYKDGDGAHKDLREIYEPGEPHNPPQWREVEPIVKLGDDTMAQIGTGANEGRIWLSWRRGGTVFSVSRYLIPGDPPSFESLARLARIVDQRGQGNAP